MNEFKYLSGGDRVNIKKTSEPGMPNLSPMHDALKRRNKATSSLENLKKHETIEQEDDEYSIPEDNESAAEIEEK